MKIFRHIYNINKTVELSVTSFSSSCDVNLCVSFWKFLMKFTYSLFIVIFERTESFF